MAGQLPGASFSSSLRCCNNSRHSPHLSTHAKAQRLGGYGAAGCLAFKAQRSNPNPSLTLPFLNALVPGLLAARGYCRGGATVIGRILHVPFIQWSEMEEGQHTTHALSLSLALSRKTNITTLDTHRYLPYKHHLGKRCGVTTLHISYSSAFPETTYVYIYMYIYMIAAARAINSIKTPHLFLVAVDREGHGEQHRAARKPGKNCEREGALSPSAHDQEAH